jgi:hypothetical protein
MRNKLPLLLTLLFAFIATGCSTTRTSKHLMQLGDTTVQARVVTCKHGGPTMINVHDDENTSVAAGLAVLRESGGRLIELIHSGKRFVTFKLGDTQHHFDPNRIFSDDGIRATLSSRGGNYSDAAHAEVREFARRIIDGFQLDREPVIVALHNTDGRGLTIQTYSQGGTKKSSSSQVHVGKDRAAGDFFYVTDRRFFDYLCARDYNVTLQDDANVPDDGSLSVYFARRGIPYVNIEADVKHLDEQTRMVRVVQDMLGELNLVTVRGRCGFGK